MHVPSIPLLQTFIWWGVLPGAMQEAVLGPVAGDAVGLALGADICLTMASLAVGAILGAVEGLVHCVVLPALVANRRATVTDIMSAVQSRTRRVLVGKGGDDNWWALSWGWCWES